MRCDMKGEGAGRGGIQRILMLTYSVVAYILVGVA